jgi:hypothetical protein
VNFEEKGYDNEDAEHYEEEREKFYLGKLNELRDSKRDDREEMEEPNARERVAWEK